LWEAASGKELSSARGGHSRLVSSAAFTPDSKDVVSASGDGSVRLWDTATGEPRWQASVGGSNVGGWLASYPSAVCPDGKTIVSATLDRSESRACVKVRRWDRETARELRGWSRELKLKKNMNSWSAVLSPDGKTLAVQEWADSREMSCWYWEVATGKQLTWIRGYCVAFSPDGKLLATVLRGEPGRQGLFALWEAATAKKLCSVSVPENVRALAFSPDGRLLATMGMGTRPPPPPRGWTIHVTRIRLWPLIRDESRPAGVRISSPRVLTEIVLPEGGLPLPVFFDWAFSPDGRTLALGGDGVADGTVRLLETATGKERRRFAGHGGDVTVLAFSPDGRRLASASQDTTVLVWDVTGRLRGGRLRPGRLSAKELEKLWAALAAGDAGRAGRAVWALAADPERAVPFLGKRLRASAAAHKALAQVPRLLRDLDDEGFAVRERAKAALARLGAAAEPALLRALARSPSAERRRSLGQLLKEARRQAPAGELLRTLRALEALGQAGTGEARAVLKGLTTATPAESSLRLEARAVLRRLERAGRR
jgi:hypothetical protein